MTLNTNGNYYIEALIFTCTLFNSVIKPLIERERATDSHQVVQDPRLETAVGLAEPYGFDLRVRSQLRGGFFACGCVGGAHLR